MALDKANVAQIAALARIKVPAADQEHLAGELSQIMTWIEQLGEVATDGVEPMAGAAQLRLPMRADIVTDGNLRERVLANAPVPAHGFFAVPKVVE